MSERVADDGGGPSIEESSIDVDGAVDGRVARRQRNIDAVLDVVLEMFAEEAMFPTIEQAAKRSGLSLRSLYRYFADPGVLLEAAIERSDRRARELSVLHAIGEGPLDQRITDFVAMRLHLHDELGPVFRATMANSTRPRVAEEMKKNRNRMRDQFELQFDSELSALTADGREHAVAAGDTLTQLHSIDYLRRHREFSIAQAEAALAAGLRSLLS